MSRISSVKTRWHQYPWKVPTIIVFVVILSAVIIIGLNRPTDEPTETTDTRPQVRTAELQQLAAAQIAQRTGIIEPASSAPLIARQGGRVTTLNAHLGDRVTAGMRIAEIDGKYAGNPTQAQFTGATAALAVFADIHTQAIRSADIAIDLAQVNLEAAERNKGVSIEVARKSREQADAQVKSARFQLQDAQDKGDDLLVRSANLALEAAELAQDQATLSVQLAQNQGSQSLQTAAHNVASAQASKDGLQADLNSQRVQLVTQRNIAREQLKLQQVQAPVSGEITSLTVREGDFVQPGEHIGEINRFSGARVTLHVTTGIRNAIQLGQNVPITTNQQSFSGQITHVATAPQSNTGLWQVDIVVTSTPHVLHPGDVAMVNLQLSAQQTGTYYVPLDAITIRSDGPQLFTVTTEGIAEAHPVTILSYDSTFVEVRSDLSPTAQVVISGNKTLRNGDSVLVTLDNENPTE